MSSIRDVLRHKGSQVWTIGPSDTVYAAIERMEDRRVGCLVVMEGESIRGVLTERDYLRKVALKGRFSKTTFVSEIMTSPVVTAHPEDDVEACLQLMTRGRFRHLPVIDGQGRLTGIVSIGDLVKEIVSDQQEELHHLDAYIRGQYPG
jgi:CBS domain-containing protein